MVADYLPLYQIERIMSLNIKNPEAHRLARELAEATGGTLTDAVTEALRDRLDEVRRKDPVDLLLDPLVRDEFETADAHRDRYRSYLVERLREPRPFLSAAVEARERRLREPPARLESRR